MPFIRRFFQVIAWALAAAIIFLSIGPASTRPVTGAGHNFEHLTIFLATGMAFGLGYPSRFRLLFVAMFAFSGAVEIAQMMAPGRHARLSRLRDGCGGFLSRSWIVVCAVEAHRDQGREELGDPRGESGLCLD